MKEAMPNIQTQRTQLFKDVYDGKIPERVPMDLSITWDAAISYAGLDLKEAQYNPEMYEIFFDKCCKDFQTDKAPIARTLRTPHFYQLLESTAFTMSKAGNMQHPEVYCLEVSEYDAFIEDPYNFMVETLLPRIYPALNTTPMKAAMILSKAYKAWNDMNGRMAAVSAKMSERYGFAKIAPGGGSEAPMDLLADLIRSFTGISKDIRRCPDKVEAACEALIPVCEKIAVSPVSSAYARTFIPLHMAPFLSQKQFERFWWPSFKKLMAYIENCGAKATLFCEQDWTKKIHYLTELPERTELWFEFGDPKLVKDTLGKRYIISGFYPVALLQTATEQECVDEAKRHIDILAPDGGYIFNTDKIIYSLNTKIADNLQAVIDTIRTYGVY